MLKNLFSKLFREQKETIPDIINCGKLPSLDGLRGFSILLVIFSHSIVGFNLGNESMSFIGNLGVNIFFVISGFLITTLLLKERVSKGTISLRNFYIRRTLRIFPIAYLYLIILIALNFIFSLAISKRSFFSAFFYLKNLPIPGDSELATSYFYTSHYWSLSIEEQFYLFFPFLLKINMRYYVIVCLAVIICQPIVTFLATHDIFYQNLFYWIYKAIGTGTASIIIGSLTSILLFKRL